MNKYGLFFITLLCVNQVSFAADAIVLRPATGEDVPQLLDLYAGFSSDDADRLVVFPIEVREAFLKKAVGAGRVFVAQDTSKDAAPIVSFCKLFMVEVEDELINIVRDELSAVSADMTVNKPHKAAQFYFPPTFSSNFGTMPVEATGGVDAYALNGLDTYVYYGGSYTHPDYRKQGICTRLERYALSVIQPAVVAKLQKQRGNLLYVCGVVQANYGGLARHRSFVQFAQKVAVNAEAVDDSSLDDLKFMVYDFNACKPTFVIAEGALKVILEEKGRGYGCFIHCNMHAAE